jgi:beta-lactamase regulating signal transducer with metallopeptidase domain
MASGAPICTPTPTPTPTPKSSVRIRVLTTFTVGFLLLDAVLLVYGGLALGRLWLVMWGGVCLIASLLVILGWRRYRRVLSDLERARREMRAEVESIRRLLHGRNLHN